jgi:hypothetical protein
VHDVERPVHDREDAERKRDSRAEAGSQPRVRDDRPDARRERDHGRERVLIEVDTGLAVHERVIERMQERDRRPGAEDERLPVPGTHGSEPACRHRRHHS